jgi:hypothetical protein
MRYQWAFAASLVLLSLGLAAIAQTPDSLPGCTYNVTPPALTTGQQVGLQCDVNGKLITTSSAGAPGQLVGTATNDNAVAGNVGQLISALLSNGAPITLTTGTPATVTSVLLTAGDWDVSGVVTYITAGTTAVSLMQSVINTTGAATAAVDAASTGSMVFTPNTVIGATNVFVVTPIVRASLAGNTTYFLNAFAGFSVSTLQASGFIRARRMR